MTRFNVYEFDRPDNGLALPVKANYPITETFGDLEAARVFAVALDKKIDENVRMKDPRYPFSKCSTDEDPI